MDRKRRICPATTDRSRSRVGRNGPSPPAHLLRRIGFDEAKRVGLGEEDAHDCAMDLVLRAFLQAREAGQSSDKTNNAVALSALSALSALLLRSDLPDDERAAWLRRCARNFARNFRRAKSIRDGHETASGTPHVSGNYKTWATSAEADALSRLFRSDVYTVVHELPPTARAVFARFHLDEDTIVEIALSSGKSQGAIKQQLHRVRQQVRIALKQKGYHAVGAALLIPFLFIVSLSFSSGSRRQFHRQVKQAGEARREKKF